LSIRTGGRDLFMDSEGVRVCSGVLMVGLSKLAFGVDTPSPDVDIMDAEDVMTRT
jgi:hypothetical protein